MGFFLQAAHSAGEENITKYILIMFIDVQPQAENLIWGAQICGEKHNSLWNAAELFELVSD